MEIIEPELGEGKVLLKGKVVLEGFIETRFKLIDSKFGFWTQIGTSIKNADGEWKVGVFTLKNDKYKAFCEQVEELYREMLSERGQELETQIPKVADMEVEVGTTFTSSDIPFMRVADAEIM